MKQACCQAKTRSQYINKSHDYIANKPSLVNCNVYIEIVSQICYLLAPSNSTQSPLSKIVND